jgi:hypothetical protein
VLFGIFNIHNNHLTQLGMINITLRYQKKKYLKQFKVFNIIWHDF